MAVIPITHTRKIELGCGRNRREFYIGIDVRDFGQEYVRDITKGLPFDDDSVDEVYACHVLEHIDKKDVSFVWEEIYRVLCPSGLLIARMPHATDPHAWLPEHLSMWSEETVKVLCNWYGSEDHHTKTNFAVAYLNQVDDELRFVLEKSDKAKNMILGNAGVLERVEW